MKATAKLIAMMMTNTRMEDMRAPSGHCSLCIEGHAGQI